jgi:uncharacterized membrane protein
MLNHDFLTAVVINLDLLTAVVNHDLLTAVILNYGMFSMFTIISLIFMVHLKIIILISLNRKRRRTGSHGVTNS